VQRFPHRRPRDRERGRELALAKPRARAELPVLDQRADTAVREVDDRARLERIEREVEAGVACDRRSLQRIDDL
jgi:hypothetical protein